MFRPDLVNRDDPHNAQASTRALSGFTAAISRRGGAPMDDMSNVFVVWSSIHGMANLVLDEKAKYLFKGATPETFVAEMLPGLLADNWPFGMSSSQNGAVVRLKRWPAPTAFFARIGCFERVANHRSVS